jgi:hypothetical protein
MLLIIGFRKPEEKTCNKFTKHKLGHRNLLKEVGETVQASVEHSRETCANATQCEGTK